MKKILFIILISIFTQSCVEKKKENKNKINIDYSGEYIGTFTDIKNKGGEIELSLFQSQNGQTGGTISIKKKDENLITGIVNINGDENGFNGSLIPSVVKYQTVTKETEKNMARYDSYSCSWSLYGKIKNEGKIIIIGKAVPMNCSESNIMEFTLEKK
ncbi:hypothetical protein N8480_02600 [Flavobacteriaceae bacterium]|jgi:hypothetical protein|nr:hypothetical protein [Flavobacterium sp.]MDC1355707.1 hypothetical protein [Flavobacteriaceae bacterium]MDC1472216.1 hypothetical protein [Flavobacteriaceae bacterium]MDC1539544.1 hypothetical protein [Flavobacteriaceae bacterium]